MLNTNFKTFLKCKISNTVNQLQSVYKNNSEYSTLFYNYTLSTGNMIKSTIILMNSAFLATLGLG